MAINYAVIAKRHVADRHIHVSIRNIGLLESLNSYICIGIQILSDHTRDIVQFHHCPALHFGRDGSRRCTYKVSDACRRFQHTAAFKPQRHKAVVHCPYYLYARIMRVLGTLSGGLILFLRQQTFQLFKLSFDAFRRLIGDFPCCVVVYGFTEYFR